MSKASEIGVPPHYLALARALVPLTHRADDALGAPVPAPTPSPDGLARLGRIARESAHATQTFTAQFNVMQERVIAREDVTEAETRRVVAGIDNALQDLVEAYLKAQTIAFAPEDAEGGRLMVAGMRKVLAYAGHMVAESTEALTDPAAVAARRGVDLASGKVPLELTFALEAPPEFAEFHRWCDAREGRLGARLAELCGWILSRAPGAGRGVLRGTSMVKLRALLRRLAEIAVMCGLVVYVYLHLVRVVVDAPFFLRSVGLMFLVALPWALLNKALAVFGIELEGWWMLLPMFLAGLVDETRPPGSR